MEITKNSIFTFGAHKGKRLSDCPDTYLSWMVANLKDTDFHIWAISAERLLQERKASDTARPDLEEAANEILRQAGCGHLAKKDPVKRQSWRRR